MPSELASIYGNTKAPGRYREGKERERDSKLKYVVLGGKRMSACGCVMRTYRTNYERFAGDADETR
ncbi:hypothetical protein ABH904_001974 [Pseudomonas frederiksbergensis]